MNKIPFSLALLTLLLIAGEILLFLHASSPSG